MAKPSQFDIVITDNRSVQTILAGLGLPVALLCYFGFAREASLFAIGFCAVSAVRVVAYAIRKVMD